MFRRRWHLKRHLLALVAVAPAIAALAVGADVGRAIEEAVAPWKQSVPAIFGHNAPASAPEASMPSNTLSAIGPAKTVCASDAVDRTRCDYVADGIDDHGEIQAAMDALTRGGRVLLSEGTFHLGASLLVRTSPLIIEGQGSGSIDGGHAGQAYATTLRMANGVNQDGIRSADTTYRHLALRHLALRGNKENNTRGNGIFSDFLNMGGHGTGPGLFDVVIEQWAENGIKGSGGEIVTFLSAQAFAISKNNGDAIQGRFQMAQIMIPNWLESNGGWGLNIDAMGDSWVEVYSEMNGKGGARFRVVNNSFIRVWAKNNWWQGLELKEEVENSIVDIVATGNGGTPQAGGKPAQLVLDSLASGNTRIRATLWARGAGTHGIYIVGKAENVFIEASTNVTGYAIYLEGLPVITDVTIANSHLRGDSGPINVAPPSGLRLFNNVQTASGVPAGGQDSPPYSYEEAPEPAAEGENDERAAR